MILPSTHKGSPRMYREHLYDAMSTVRQYCKPDLFIQVNVTCSLRWQEITNSLNKDEMCVDRPDIMNRVFHMKLTDFMNQMIKKKKMGKVLACIRVIEFQKRDLPQCHVLFILYKENKIFTTARH